MNLRFNEGSSISDHLNEFQGCFDQLSDMGVKFEDEILGLWLLNTLPDSWENLRVSLISSAPGGTVTMEYVKAAVLNEEVRHRTHETSTSKSDVLVIENRGRSKDRDHGEFKRGKSRSKSRSKYKNVECHYCHKKGHLMKNCFKLKNKDKNKPEGKDGENDRHVATTTSGDLIVVSDNDLINVAFDESSWVIDSGAAFHVTSRKDFFTSYTPGDYGVLKMGNDGRSQVVGIGVVVLETRTGMKLVLKNVRHAPDIRLNLISTSVLDDEGYMSTFGDGGDLIVVSDNDLINVASDESSWVIDSGAAFHVTSRKDFFTSYTPGDYGVLKMGNDGRSQVVGIGVVVLETRTGMKLVLKNVRHAPDIRLNLISTSVLDDEGYMSTFGDGQCKLTKGSLIVARGKKCSGLYWTNASVSIDSVNAVESDSSSELWHRRLSHISEKGLDCLAKKNVLSGVKDANLKRSSMVRERCFL
ncbi:unnamed protein product [Cuscuta campestris]|uniref:Uncharacterized protein n=1 Tax=Cuscuta campestris TaxID=132261 RepID=A0A484K7E4_9ASTE|nr:unnamed protein product [Cuscuta campestris]